MKRLKSVFRPNTETSETSTSRRTWRRTTAKPQPETTTTRTGNDSAEAGLSGAQNKAVSSDVAPVENPQPAPQAQGSGELRSKYGTKRLKKIVQRFRNSISHEDEPLREQNPSDYPESTAEVPIVFERDSGNPLSSNPPDQPHIIFDDDQVRQVSAQMSNSEQTQETAKSEDTVCHHPPDCPHPPENSPERIEVDVEQETEKWDWPGLMFNPGEGGRAREFSDPFSDPVSIPLSETPSDPFSDGKGTEYHQAGAIPREMPSVSSLASAAGPFSITGPASAKSQTIAGILPGGVPPSIAGPSSAEPPSAAGLAPATGTSSAARPSSIAGSSGTGPPRYSPYQSRDGSRASEGVLEPISEDLKEEILAIDAIVAIEPSKRRSGHGKARESTGTSDESTYSQKSQASTLTRNKAIDNFNRMAEQQGIPVKVAPEGDASSPTPPTSDSSTNDMVIGQAVQVPLPLPTGAAALQAVPKLEGQGRGLFGRLRKSRSNLEAPTQTRTKKQNPLRRVKTFANLRREPMTALNGKSLETLARLGGISFIMIKDLGPPPLQLPACIVAAVMFLHRSGQDQPLLFIECPDMKAAIRTYDRWAGHVAEGEKIQDELDTTMRTIGMPTLGESSLPVPSAAWALRAVLAGLPYGILGSVRLYQTLRDLCYAPIPEKSALQVPRCLRGLAPNVAIRVQLIALLVIGLASDMQRDLICTIFGLLDYLMHPELSLEEQRRAKETGTDPRIAVAPPQYQELIRSFAPLLLGQKTRSRGKLDRVEQDLGQENRVVTFLIEHWHHVNRQLREWSNDSCPAQ